MKKKLVAGLTVGLMMLGGTAWSGQYDGVWQVSGDNYYQFIRSDDSTGLTVVASIGNDENPQQTSGSWSNTLVGYLVGGNILNFTGQDTIDQYPNSGTVTFTSSTTATLVMNSCTEKPGQGHNGSCPPLYTPLQMTKLL